MRVRGTMASLMALTVSIGGLMLSPAQTSAQNYSDFTPPPPKEAPEPGGNLGNRNPAAAQAGAGAGPQARRPANTFCTEVDIGDLPPGATVKAVMVTLSRKGKSATQEEQDLSLRCYGLTEQHGAKTFAASQTPDSVDLRVPALIAASLQPAQRQGIDFAYAGSAAREQLTADSKGEIQIFVPREDLDTTANVMQGNTVETFGL